jgi:putative flippase GtrA
MSASILTVIDYRLGRFAVVGAANTIAGLALIFACKAFLGLGDVAANFIGYAIALLIGFALNKRWTFDYGGPAAGAFGRYLLVLLVAYLANLCVTLFAIRVMQMNGYLAQAAGVLPYAITGYLGSRFFAFAR